jgi:hypothetical protein
MSISVYQEHDIFCEKYRPVTIDDYIGNEHIKEKIRTGQDMFNRNNPYVPTQPGDIPQDILEIFGKIQDKLLKAIE